MRKKTNKILISIKGCNSATNFLKMTLYNHNLDLINGQGQLLEGVECHIYLYCFTFDDINLNRVLSLLSYFQKNIAIRKCVQIK